MHIYVIGKRGRIEFFLYHTDFLKEIWTPFLFVRKDG